MNLTANLAAELEPRSETLLRLSSVTPRETTHPDEDSVADVTSLTPYVACTLELITVIMVLKLWISLTLIRDLNDRIRNWVVIGRISLH
jgi:hypothetical protein